MVGSFDGSMVESKATLKPSDSQTIKPKRVVVAMSGGIDSSVAAAMLLDKGYEVIGVTMRMWSSDDETIEKIARQSEQDASRVASNLGIRHHVLDVRNEFAGCVVRNFVDEYSRGRTPNPCVVCNPRIKFGELLKYTQDELDAEYVATGHYARIVWDASTSKWKLLKGVDRTKDQAYVLYRLNQSQLGKILMPLGYHTKKEVRAMADQLNLHLADRPESQDICFIPGGGYQDFLRKSAPELMQPGPIVDTSGKVLGEHEGIAFYTVGQRRGLRVASGRRLYVIAIDVRSNTIVLGEPGEFGQKAVLIKNVNMISGEKLSKSIAVSAKIRYNAQDSPAVLRPLPDECAVLDFEQTQRAVTPGQSAVFYDGDEVLGGGIIADRVESALESEVRR
ncbi:tRNA 2-thiouridine(34) synthase MnmA [bacterium]|nr:tRNA 2-thiouridine(34) synthase MnmA [bacterium]